MDDEVRGTTLRQLLRHQDAKTVPPIELLRQAEEAGLCTLVRDEKSGLVVTPEGAWAEVVGAPKPKKSRKKPAAKK